MSTIEVVNHVTLDGVMQAPAHPDEDRRGGFEHGGWAAPYNDDVMMQVAQEGMAKSDSFLFGRLTYEKMRAAWSGQPDDNPFANVLNNRQKHVASRTLSEAASNASPSWCRRGTPGSFRPTSSR